MGLKHLLRFISIALLCFSCSKNVEPDQQGGNNHESEENRKTEFTDFTLKSTAVYFGDEFEKYISVIDTNTVVLRADTPEVLMPKKGEVIFIPSSSANPNGFLGKVLSVTRSDSTPAEIETEAATLEETFEELHINEAISVSQLMDEVMDDEGNIIPCGFLPDEVWDDPQTVLDSLAQLSPNARTKAMENSASYTRTIAFHYAGITGELVLSASLSVIIDISKGKLNNYDIVLSKKSFINTTIEEAYSIPDNFSKKQILPLRTWSLPASIVVGPIVLRPAIVSSMDLVMTGDVKIQASAGVGIEEVISRWHNGEQTTSHGGPHPNYISATFLEASGGFGLEPRIGLQFGVFGQQLLAFGIDAISTLMVGLSGKISMDDEDLLKKEAAATMTLGTSLGVYFYSKFFSGKYDETRISVDFPEKSWTMNLLNVGKDKKIAKSIGEWTVSGDFSGKQFMKVDEKGFALFVKGESTPVDVKAVVGKNSTSGTRAKDQNAVTFDITKSSNRYEVRPYNRVGDYFFYGKPLNKLIKAIRVTGDANINYGFTYDSADRLTNINSSLGSWVYTYHENSIGYESVNETDRLYLDENGRLVKAVAHFDNGEYSFISTTTVSYDSSNNPSLFGDRGDLHYSGGNLIREDNYGYYSYSSELLDNMNLDVIHYLVTINSNEVLLPFLSLPYLHNKNLCTHCTIDYGAKGDSGVPFVSFSVSYEFDEEGDVTKIICGDLRTISLSY